MQGFLDHLSHLDDRQGEDNLAGLNVGSDTEANTLWPVIFA